jgi:proline dehydrogenase
MPGRRMRWLNPCCSKNNFRYNKGRAQILNTYQAYLKNTYNTIEIDIDLAKKRDYKFALKLVRGAYINQERKRAAQFGYEDPVNPTYEV